MDFGYGTILRLLDYVGHPYKKVGSNYMGPCPACGRGNKTPNTVFNPDTNSFKCFSCDESAGLKKTAEYLGVDWNRFVKDQGYKTKKDQGYKHKKSTNPLTRTQQETKKKILFNEIATKSISKDVLDYLARRGIKFTKEEIKNSNYIYSLRDIDNRWVKSLKEKGYGLVIPARLNGEVKFFKIRYIGTGEIDKKSLNPPAYKPYMFGIDEIEHKNVIIVEGEIDWLTMKYLFKDEPFSILGVPLSGHTPDPEEIQAIKDKGVEKVFILYDNDKAGEKGSLKIGKVFSDNKFETYVVRINEPGFNDINEILQEYDEDITRDYLLDIIANAKTIDEYEDEVRKKKFGIIRSGLIEAKDMEFALKGFMPLCYGTLGMLSGSGGTGKSWIAIQLGLRFILETGKKAFLWLAEEPAPLIKWRRNKVIEMLAREGELLNAIDDNNLDQLTVEEYLSEIADQNLYISDSTDTLLEEDDIAELRKATHDIDLVILDPLIAFYTGDNENDNSKARRFMQQYTKWAKEDNKILLFIHHFSKAKDVDGTRSRGASAFVDACRYVYDIESIKETGGAKKKGFVKVKLSKDNLGAIRFMPNREFEVERKIYSESLIVNEGEAYLNELRAKSTGSSLMDIKPDPDIGKEIDDFLDNF